MWIIGLAFAGEVCTTYDGTEAPVEADDAIPAIQASGLAAARTADDLYYTHDDNSGAAELYAMRGDGTLVVTQAIQGAVNEDWEDLSPGPCPDSIDAEACLWIADIGDNEEDRPTVVVWVVRESTDASETAVQCTLAYPEGKKHDAEALFVTPDGTLRIVTKDNDGARIFRLAHPKCDGGAAQTLTEEAEVVLEEEVTGAAVSADGNAVVLRGLTKAWLWTGCAYAWHDTPTPVDLGVQPQGEAVTFGSDGALWSTSEIGPLRLWRTPCAETEPLTCPACGCGGGSALVLLLPLGAWVRRRTPPDVRRGTGGRRRA